MMDAEEEITINTPARIRTELSLGNDVPPRLIYRTLEWCERKLHEADAGFRAIRATVATLPE